MTDKLWHNMKGLLRKNKHIVFIRRGTEQIECYYTMDGQPLSQPGKFAYVEDLVATANRTTVLQKKLDKAMDALLKISQTSSHYHGCDVVATDALNEIKEIENIKE